MKKSIVLLLVFFAGLKMNASNYNSFIFGVCYYPEHWPETMWEKDAQMMKECGVNTVRIGEFAWYYFEPEEGVFQFDLFDRAIGVFAKYDIKVILGTPTAAPPKWLTQKYPEVLVVDPNGEKRNDQTRQHTSYSSPKYLEFCRKITEALAIHYGKNKNVIGWQIDNEIHCHVRESFSNNDQIEFRKFLETKYKNIDSLNNRWGNKFWSQWYTEWMQISMPINTSSFHNPSLMLDYKRFLSESGIKYFNIQTAIIRKYCPDDFITTNGTFTDLDYYKMTKGMEIYSHDNYPCFVQQPQYWAATMATISRGFNGRFMIMEEQTGPGGQTYLLRSPRPGEMSLWAFQMLAHGADGMSHFRWRTALKGAEEYWYGVLDQDNTPRERYDEFKKEGNQMQKIGNEILGSVIKSDIAVLRDFENEWVYDYQYLTKEVKASGVYSDFVRAASELKYNIDIVGFEIDFSKYKIIFAPYMIMMSPSLASKIQKFVSAGGVFITGAHTAVKDFDNSMTWNTWPIYLTKLFGVEVGSFNCYQMPSATSNFINIGNDSLAVNVFADILKLNTAKSIGTWGMDYMKGMPACTENKFDSGMAVYYSSFFNYNAIKVLMKRYTSELALNQILKGFPENIELTSRNKGSTTFYFILNHNSESVNINLNTSFFDIINDVNISGNYNMKPFEYLVLRSVN